MNMDTVNPAYLLTGSLISLLFYFICGYDSLSISASSVLIWRRGHFCYTHLSACWQYGRTAYHWTRDKSIKKLLISRGGTTTQMNQPEYTERLKNMRVKMKALGREDEKDWFVRCQDFDEKKDAYLLDIRWYHLESAWVYRPAPLNCDSRYHHKQEFDDICSYFFFQNKT